jgi:hypothetical protein
VCLHGKGGGRVMGEYVRRSFRKEGRFIFFRQREAWPISLTSFSNREVFAPHLRRLLEGRFGLRPFAKRQVNFA